MLPGRGNTKSLYGSKWSSCSSSAQYFPFINSYNSSSCKINSGATGINLRAARAEESGKIWETVILKERIDHCFVK